MKASVPWAGHQKKFIIITIYLQADNHLESDNVRKLGFIPTVDSDSQKMDNGSNG